MNYKTYTDLNGDIRNNLSKIAHMDFDLIVGLPRSGMIPAYMIALFLNVNCTDLNSFIENRPLKRGITRKCRHDLHNPHDAKKVLVVDDSIYSGGSMKRDVASIPPELRDKVVTMAVYSATKTRDDIDLFFGYVPLPRVFEWNILHHDIMTQACFDIDGVLCVDPTDEQNDDGSKYRAFLLDAAPLFLPSTSVYALVTSRLEKYRPETEQWLKKHGVVYDNLIMIDLPTKEERQRLGNHGKHKAAYYRQSESTFFVESEPHQAQEICGLTGKLVYCTKDNILYSPDYLSLMRNPKSFRGHIIKRVRYFLRPVKRFVVNKLLS